MKVTAAITILAAAANTAMAVPVAPREQSGIFGDVFDLATGIFKGGVSTAFGLANLAFDGATCVTSSFLGGQKPTCKGRAILGGNGGITTTKGDSSSNINHQSNSDSFSFTYTTEADGKLKVTITPDAQGRSPCITVVEKKGEIKEIVAREAKKCL
ncbi:hypothetical protein ACHAPT_008276 [Fusarium lateritium]